MARVIWKGSISFGLVHVPVSLYSAERRDELSFSMLDRRDMAPVGYKRINKQTGKDVPWEDVVKGYEYDRDQYVILDDEDFKKANVKATQTVEIVDFVEEGSVPLVYFDRPYYLEPSERGQKVYALLREALRNSGRIGIAKVVLRNRQHLAALMPQGNLLVLDLLRFHNELRDAGEFSVPDEDLDSLGISDKELEMARRLIDDMSSDWVPERYHDEYREDLLELVEQKVRAGKLTEVAPAEAKGRGRAPRRGAEVIDLMSLLKKSVEEKEQVGGNKDKGRKKTSTAKTSRKKSSRKSSSTRKRA